MKVYQAINAVQSDLSRSGISKDRENSFDKYKFRGIDGFPAYQVSCDGEVYSLATDKLLKPRTVNGYHLVTIGGRNGKQIAVHVLVAEAFICKRPEGKVINHKNGVRTDNRLANLEWVSQSENVRHAYALGLRVINEAHRARCAALGRAKRKETLQ